jgi:hypothetical protein
MDKYRNLAGYAVQRILLSATVPPIFQELLLEHSALPRSTLFIRAPTQRPLIRYHIIHLEHGIHKGLHEYTISLAQHLQQSIFRTDSNGIIYVNTKANAKVIGESFDNCIHTSDLSVEEKDANVQRWSNGQSKWIIATDGFALGINRPFVDAVIMVALPHSFIDLMQQPGRGGRGGRPSMAFLVEDFGTQWITGNGDEVDPHMTAEAVQFRDNKTVCRREMLSVQMDGIDLKVTCQTLHGAEKCDLCDPNAPLNQAALALRIPDQGVEEDLFKSFDDFDWHELSILEDRPEMAPNPMPIARAHTAANAEIRGTTVEEDAQRIHEGTIQKHRKNQELSRALEFLKNICHVCWAISNVVERHQHVGMLSALQGGHAVFVSCGQTTGIQLPHQGWLDIKKAMRFREYAYCWKCSLPLNPMVDCHQGYQVGRGLPCPFEDIIVHICWVIWNLNEYRTSAASNFQGFSVECSVQEYAKWLSEEGDRVCSFHNAIELFLWFCHKYRPYVLGGTVNQPIESGSVKTLPNNTLGKYTSLLVHS